MQTLLKASWRTSTARGVCSACLFLLQEVRRCSACRLPAFTLFGWILKSGYELWGRAELQRLVEAEKDLLWQPKGGGYCKDCNKMDTVLPVPACSQVLKEIVHTRLSGWSS